MVEKQLSLPVNAKRAAHDLILGKRTALMHTERTYVIWDTALVPC